jgi:hypothetical protein
VIQDAITAEFKWLGSSSKGVSSGALLPSQTTNARTVGASVDGVSTLGKVVCTFIQDGQDQLEVLITEATIQETTITEVSAYNRKGGATVWKIRPSDFPEKITNS